MRKIRLSVRKINPDKIKYFSKFSMSFLAVMTFSLSVASYVHLRTGANTPYRNQILGKQIDEILGISEIVVSLDRKIINFIKIRELISGMDVEFYNKRISQSQYLSSSEQILSKKEMELQEVAKLFLILDEKVMSASLVVASNSMEKITKIRDSRKEYIQGLELWFRSIIDHTRIDITYVCSILPPFSNQFKVQYTDMVKSIRHDLGVDVLSVDYYLSVIGHYDHEIVP
jgi:hypothetical protein